MRFRVGLLFFLIPGFLWLITPSAFCDEGESRFARADSLSGYVHWIDLIDEQVNKIDPSAEQPPPYSPLKTCGRCHDYNSIAHGWHFDAVARDHNGRPGQPWIWNDARTGTHLPLSYRGWLGTFDPDRLGIARWAIAKQFGGYLPGGGPGSPESLKFNVPTLNDHTQANPTVADSQDRSEITGPLPIDCMLCHRNDRSYSPDAWTKQIADENFAYAPTVAAGLATIAGSMERIRTKPESTATGNSPPLPTLKYDATRFRNDGKVFFDIIRKPSNNSCNYCHTNLTAEAFGSNRWTHDDDIHVRAGMACADCHRNSLDHQTIRGFEGEISPQLKPLESLTCRGCHIGNPSQATRSSSSRSLAGRMGAPLPAHRGLPLVHFEKLACTACHSGPLPEAEPTRIVNSIAHRLGSPAHRSSDELPGIVAPVMLTHGPEARYSPHRMTWPAYWGIMKENSVTPLEPENAFQLTRTSLKVRKDFSQELIEVKPSLSDRKSILGDDRAKVKESDLSEEERKKVLAWTTLQGQKQLKSRLADAMTSIEKANPGFTAVYIAGGLGYRRNASDKEDPVEVIPAEELGDAAKPYAWPMAHDVRPARMSLGVQGCTECHHHDAPFFSSQITAVGTLPGFDTASVPVHQLQAVDIHRIDQWNMLFEGRTVFKIFAFICLGLLSVIVLGSLAWNIGRRVSRLGAT